MKYNNIYQCLCSNTSETSADELGSVIIGGSSAVEGVLEELVEEEFEGREGCDLEAVDTIALKHAHPSLLLPHVSKCLC